MEKNRFGRTMPQPGETRRYATDTTYGDGTYIITRELSGEWSAWVVENVHDPSAARRGWRGIAREKTMRAARAACESHRTDLHESPCHSKQHNCGE